jgi:hypothetical protein
MIAGIISYWNRLHQVLITQSVSKHTTACQSISKNLGATSVAQLSVVALDKGWAIAGELRLYGLISIDYAQQMIPSKSILLILLVPFTKCSPRVTDIQLEQ